MKQFLIALDQLLNTLLGGMADETISARAYRNRATWPRRMAAINWLMRDPQHCKKSFESEELRMQLPKAYRLYN